MLAERELARDLEPLRLAAGQRRGRLAESQIAESDLLQLPERLAELLLAREEANRLVDGELEHVVDVLAVARARRAPSGLKRLPPQSSHGTNTSAMNTISTSR